MILMVILLLKVMSKFHLFIYSIRMGGQSIPVLVKLAPSDPSIVIASLPNLPKGTYSVEWSVLSDDGHPVSGDFFFAFGQKVTNSAGENIVSHPISLFLLVVLRSLSEGYIPFVFPSEKESSTIKIQLDFPKDVSVETVQPLAGWNYQFIKGSDGRNKGIVWTANGDGIKVHEFLEFTFIGANPKQEANLSWNAHQTYSDGSVVNWTGKPGSDKPASVTKISEKLSTTDTTQATEPTPSIPKNEWTAIIIASVAFCCHLFHYFEKEGRFNVQKLAIYY